MNENDVIETLRKYISRQFPKECRSCGKRYESFAEFIRNTTYVGKPLSYDAERDDWQPARPLGTIGLANCSCGSTLAISSSRMNLITYWRLMNWARKEIKHQEITSNDLLEDLRRKIDQSVLEDEGKTNEN
jgi:hypothetical protein